MTSGMETNKLTNYHDAKSGSLLLARNSWPFKQTFTGRCKPPDKRDRKSRISDIECVSNIMLSRTSMYERPAAVVRAAQSQMSVSVWWTTGGRVMFCVNTCPFLLSHLVATVAHWTASTIVWNDVQCVPKNVHNLIVFIAILQKSQMADFSNIRQTYENY